MKAETNQERRGDVTAKRVESGNAMKDSHAELAYTEWLKAEVQAAIDDTSPTIPHEEAMRLVRAAIKLA